MDPWRIALSALSPDAQLAITQTRERNAKRMLAASPFLTPEAATALLAQRGLHAHTAVRALHDQDHLHTEAMRPGVTAAWAARNPRTRSVDLAVLAARNSRVRYWALCNESLDESIRKKLLTEKLVAALCESGGSNAEKLGRAVHLVKANWWMAETPHRWPASVRRAIALDPRADDTTLANVKAAGSARWPMLEHRPAAPTSTMTTAELLINGGTTAAMAAMERDDITYDQAHALLRDTRSEVETAVIAAAVTRFGVGIADGMPCSLTKVRSAYVFEPSVQYVFFDQPSIVGFEDAARRAGEILGGNVDAWNVYGSLTVSGHRDMVEMATAAVELV
jgi:hypothetical protein